MPLLRPPRWPWFASALAVVALLSPGSETAAQSLTAGSLKGQVRGAQGAGVGGAQVTIESRAGGGRLEIETGTDGSFQLPLIAPGDYSILVEQIGYQPVRRTSVLVAPGRLTSVTIDIVKRPPPITTVEEQAGPSGATGMTQGRLVSDAELRTLDRRRDVADVTRGATEVVTATDGREGFGIAASGLPSTMSRFLVDGVLETMLRHPGFRDEPARTPLFQRDGVDQAEIIGVPIDAEWRGTQGSIFSVQTRRGGNRLSFRPYASFSTAKLGGRALDNSGDSTASSIQAGAVITGAIVPDTAHFLLRFDFQSSEQPSARPWQRDTSTYANQPVSLLTALPAIASDSFGTAINGVVAAPVRSYKGGSGFGRVDWRVGPSTTVGARAGYATWKERGWSLGEDLASGAGSRLDARDGSAAVNVTSSGEKQANEFRAGFNIARREFLGTPIANTTIVANGAGFGTPLGLPGLFDTKVVDVSDAYQRQAGHHRLKVGASASFVNYRQDYRFGSGGAFVFSDLGAFGLGRGSFYQVTGPAETAQFTATEVGVFAQDTWTVTPEIQLLIGLRYEVQRLPNARVNRNAGWEALTGIRNDSIPRDKRGFSPRVGFVWDVQNRGEWILRGGGGIQAGRMDPSTFAEAILFDHDVQVRRGLADFNAWPNTPDLVQAPAAGQRLTVINSTYRNPRTAAFEFGITRQMVGAEFRINGSYHHTDFLLRRRDLNLSTSGSATQEGRPVFGTLVQRGSLVVPATGSNRRFTEFDLVSGLSPTGSADHYEATASLERRMNDRLSALVSYTYSKTTDNLVGARSPDPADQLSPFPDLLAGADWTKGRSDFDVPHRGAVTLRYRSVGRNPLTIAARYRVRSGLPYTPGFQPSVDANGDGSGNNDPAFLNGGISGLAEALSGGHCSGGLSGAFAVRNSCREDLAQSLDLHLSVGLPFGAKGDRLTLKIDGFNLVATQAGLVDRALTLIDPAGTLSVNGGGNVTLPLIANPNFGSILVRRGEPRMVRVGLSLEY